MATGFLSSFAVDSWWCSSLMLTPPSPLSSLLSLFRGSVAAFSPCFALALFAPSSGDGSVHCKLLIHRCFWCQVLACHRVRHLGLPPVGHWNSLEAFDDLQWARCGSMSSWILCLRISCLQIQDSAQVFEVMNLVAFLALSSPHSSINLRIFYPLQILARYSCFWLIY